MSDRERVRRAVLRNDFMAFYQRVFRTLEPGTLFMPNWHQEHLCHLLSSVWRGESKRLIINVPPRSGKSHLATIAFPLFVLGHDPSRRVICISHTEDLARKFSIDRRTVAQSPWFQALFPNLRLPARSRDVELTTDRQGSILAAGVGGSILGRGADFIVVDDPLKGLDALSEAERRRVAEFYDNTLSTRLNDKKTGAIIIVMQRLHQDDLVGHVLEKDDWHLVSLPAIAAEDSVHPLSEIPGDVYHRRSGELLHEARESREVLEQLRRAQGSMLFSAQYQQEPVPAGGNVIRREWLRFGTPRPGRYDRVVVSWDTASTLGENSDWSVGTVWGAAGVDYHLLDVVRGRFESPDLRREILVLTERYSADATLIEDTELGRALSQDLRRTGGLRPLTLHPRFDKLARLLAQAARFEAGQVHLPQDAPWLAAYVSELLAFPNGRHDDQVDSTSQALKFLTDRNPPSTPLTRREVVRRQSVDRR